MHHSKLKHSIHLFLGVAALVLIGMGAWAALATNAGAVWLVRNVMMPRVQAESVRVARIDGVVWGELLLRDVEVLNPDDFPIGTRVRIQRVRVDLRSFVRRSERKVVAERVRVVVPGRVRGLGIERAEWGSLRGFTLRDIEARGIVGIPEDAVLKIQRLSGPFPLPESGFCFDEIHNGRLKLDYSEPIVFFGKYSPEYVGITVYCRSVSVPNLIRLFGIESLGNTNGILTGIDIAITGPLEQPNVSGEFRVKRLKHDTMTLNNSPGTLRIAIRKAGKENTYSGNLKLESGSLGLKGVVMDLAPSRLIFTGHLEMPRLKIRARTKIEGVKINVLVEGRKDDPELKLTSEPPLHEDNLLLMLATGRRWTGTEKALSDGSASPDAAKEFIDYFVFGGSGDRLARKLGIDQVSLRYDERERGVEVKKKVNSHVGLVYGVNQPNVVEKTEENPAQQEVTHKIGAEYRFSDSSSVAVEGQRTLKPEGQVAGPPADEAKETNEKLLLKFDRRF